MEQGIDIKFFVFQIIAFELGVTNSCNLEQDICHQLSLCQETPLRFHLKLREIFSKSISLRMMEKHDKCAVSKILQVFGPLSHVDCQSLF